MCVCVCVCVCKQDSAFDNQQGLICLKSQPVSKKILFLNCFVFRLWIISEKLCWLQFYTFVFIENTENFDYEAHDYSEGIYAIINKIKYKYSF